MTTTLTASAHAALSAELKALQKNNDELIDCLRQITRCTKIRGPLGTAAYIISEEAMSEAQRLVGAEARDS